VQVTELFRPARQGIYNDITLNKMLCLTPPPVVTLMWKVSLAQSRDFQDSIVIGLAPHCLDINYRRLAPFGIIWSAFPKSTHGSS